MYPLIALVYGSLVGLSLGLTGGGGAIFAVPLLVYGGLGVSPREAVGISLAAVGVTAGVGFLRRWQSGQVEIRTGLLFAVAGMLGAPVGSWVAGWLPETLLLILFAGLMTVVAVRLWQKSTPPDVTWTHSHSDPAPDAACRRDSSGMLIFNTRCAVMLLVLGTLTGVLAGLFGVGGGFVIVPALVLFSRMEIHRAIGTSLMVIALVSVSGVGAHLLAGRGLALDLTGLFILGGMGGLFLGQLIGRHLSGPVLQRVFSAAILAVAAFVLLKNLST